MNEPLDQTPRPIDYVDAEYIVRQLGAMPHDLKVEFINDFANAFWQAARGRALPDAKQFVTTRILNNGDEITTNSSGTNIGLSGGKSQFDILNFIGNTAAINSESNARQVDITMGGGGADCMFDVLISTCFSDLANWTEGKSFKSVSGCTFYGYTTVQAGLDKMVALTGAQAMYICHGSYTENLSIQAIGTAYSVIGAGEDIVTISAASSGNPTLEIGTETTFTLTGVTLVGNGSNVVLNHVNSGLLQVTDVTLKPQASGTGLEFTGGEFILGLKIAGSSAGFGITNGSSPGPPSFFNDLWITGCSTAIQMLGGPNRLEVRSAYISAATKGLDLGSDTGGDQSIMTGIVFDSCTTGIHMIANTPNSTLITSNVFYKCPTGIDLTGLSYDGISAFGASGTSISNNIFYTTTGSHLGIKASTGDPGFRYGMITGNNFVGYTSGNEISGTTSFGTGTQVFHNVSNAGTLADFGSPVGHSSSSGGSGSAAPNDQTFLTVTNEATALPNSRQITAGSGISLTDGGAGSTETIAVDTTAVYSRVQFIWAPDAAPGATVVAGNQQGNIYHTGPAGFTAIKLYVDAESAPGASGLPITIEYGDTDDLDTVASWTTVATLTLSSEKSTNTTTMSNATVPADRLLRMDVGTIVGSPKDVTITLQGKAKLTT